MSIFFKSIYNPCSWIVVMLILSAHLHGATDPLPSWNEGSVKQGILEFVSAVTQEPSPHYVPTKDRIAAIDNDGTLWVEQPLYVEYIYTLETIKSMAPDHPEWTNQEPYKSILSEGLEAIKSLNAHEVEQLIAETHAGMSIDDFHNKVKQWIAHAIHPRYKRPFTELVYQPMLELIQLLKDNHFQVYIVSGGGQEFMRAFAEQLYGLPPGHIIGTTGKVAYEYRDGKPALLKLPQVLFIDDKQGKPEGINLIIGQRPIAAFGNSIGDQQMLEWTQANPSPNFELLVHHDDPVREYAYGPDSKVGTFSDALMKEAKANKWFVVSMKNDWKVIFPWEK